MAGKKKGRNPNKEGALRTIANTNKRITKATKNGKSVNYIKDLNTRLERLKKVRIK